MAQLAPFTQGAVYRTREDLRKAATLKAAEDATKLRVLISQPGRVDRARVYLGCTANGTRAGQSQCTYRMHATESNGVWQVTKACYNHSHPITAEQATAMQNADASGPPRLNQGQTFATRDAFVALVNLRGSADAVELRVFVDLGKLARRARFAMCCSHNSKTNARKQQRCTYSFVAIEYENVGWRVTQCNFTHKHDHLEPTVRGKGTKKKKAKPVEEEEDAPGDEEYGSGISGGGGEEFDPTSPSTSGQYSAVSTSTSNSISPATVGFTPQILPPLPKLPALSEMPAQPPIPAFGQPFYPVFPTYDGFSQVTMPPQTMPEGVPTSFPPVGPGIWPPFQHVPFPMHGYMPVTSIPGVSEMPRFTANGLPSFPPSHLPVVSTGQVLVAGSDDESRKGPPSLTKLLN